ncbi:MAG TPA: hypothetical protein VJ952_05550 [Opitutales bacterium]|nr:hypothetical protein [Opitutales bacterium]
MPILFLGAVCGLIAAIVMNLFMRAVGRSFGRSADMVRALGSFFTGKLENADSVGSAIHAGSGICFGMIYLTIMDALGALVFPQAIFLGLGIGFAHGLVTSYALMIFASERHPLEDYRKATMQEGALHFFGHLIFGVVTGLLGGLIAMGLS